MYCKLALKQGATLSELKNDLVGLLTNTILDKNALTSADAATSELVIKEAAEWTFVQDLADTTTRKHFVLEGVEKAGIKKTLGIVLTESSGTLHYQAWACGPWDAVNKRPMPYDPTGKSMSPYGATASEWAAPGGTSRHTIFMLTAFYTGEVNTARSAGVPVGTGTGVLLVSSRQGSTRVSAHAGTSNAELLEVCDIPRDVYGPLFADAEAWPYPLFWAAGNTVLGGMLSCPVPGLSAYNAAGCGVLLGSDSSLGSLSGPITSELGLTRAWPTRPWSTAGRNLLTFGRNGKTGMSCHVRASDREAPERYVSLAAPHLNSEDDCVAPVFDAKQVSTMVRDVDSTAQVGTAFLDEIIAGEDTFVSTGVRNSMSRCHWKG